VLAAISEGTWAFLGVLVANIVLLIGLFYRQGAMRQGIDRIDTAVNHQAEGEPTLVERVANVERAVASAQVHWERTSLNNAPALSSARLYNQRRRF
jgi:hypothetical protein